MKKIANQIYFLFKITVKCKLKNNVGSIHNMNWSFILKYNHEKEEDHFWILMV
jgi:hypothetical protein